MHSPKIKLQIITPEESLSFSECDMLTVPTQDGEIGILPGHMPLMTLVWPGELTVTTAGETRDYSVGEGFLRVHNDQVTLLTDSAEGDRPSGVTPGAP